MPKLKSVASLEKYRQTLSNTRESKKICVAICSGTGCLALKNAEVTQSFIDEIDRRGLQSKVDVRRTGCLGFCKEGPVVMIFPREICYVRVKPEDVPEIVSTTLVDNRIVGRLLYSGPDSRNIICEGDIPFYKYQTRLICGNNKKIDYHSIDDYITIGGYSALSKVLSGMPPEQVLKEVKNSNLRGRGGAGFPAGIKWETTRNAPGDIKYVIVNADEGNPGAFGDGSILEGNPHQVLEGLIIGAYTLWL
jgi:NADH-quinone oxidoreductase subunit F